jgi:acyl carrier protein
MPTMKFKNLPLVQEVVGKFLNKKPEKILPEHRLEEDLGADGAVQVLILMTLEDVTGCRFSEEEADQARKSIAGIVQLLESHQK